MPEVTITITTSDTDHVHTCDPNCDCPRALALTQEAIDADRFERGAAPRLLSERLHAMRYATPSRQWFELASVEAARLETAAQPVEARQAAAWAASADEQDAWTPKERASHLQAAMTDLVKILSRGGVLPADAELVHDPAGYESRVIAGNLCFVASLTGSIDTPARGYVVTTTDDGQADGGPEERATVDLDMVRAWFTFWAAETVYARL